VAGPLIPYIEAPELPLSFLKYIPLLNSYIDASDPPSIKPFGTLVALGVYIGTAITMQRARQRGLDTKPLSDFIFWTVAAGFVISHLFDAITYHPDTVAKDPLYLLRIWDGLSSYGGLMGAVCGSVAWGVRHKKRIMEYVDLCVSAFPTAWVFGRAGCATVHDHPGALSNAWFAVKYPAHTLQAGFEGRYDLGLIEMVLTIPLSFACHALWRRNPYRPNGFFVGLTLVAYAPVRFVLDFLRVTPEDQVFRGAIDPRYGGLTPAQWICFLALGVGVLFLVRTHKAKYVRQGDLAPVEGEGAADEGDDEDDAEDDEDDEERLPPKRHKPAPKAPASPAPRSEAKKPPATTSPPSNAKKKRKKVGATKRKKAPTG
jgi:phosphatidylglycerol:prolipoprotein diacylglycerol transferase